LENELRIREAKIEELMDVAEVVDNQDSEIKNLR